MKKRKIILFSLIIVLCVLVGFAAYPVLTNETFKNNELSSTTENNVANEYLNSDATKEDAKKVLSSVFKPENDVVSQELSSAESISIEDKAVMSEIAKYVETSIEFKFNKQESINDKSYNLTFSEVDSTTDYKRIIYKNSIGDEFAYNTDNGKLRYAVMDSAVTEKTVASIDKTTAQKIAAEYVATKCNIEEYTMNFFKENDKGYYFCFTRYIGYYPSSDIYGIKVGYAGDIVYLSDNTHVFDDKNIDFDKDYIDTKIKEHSNETEVDWDSIEVCIEEGKLAVKYTIPEQHAIAILPLE